MGGKGFNFATRVTAETRDALEAEASRTGRSKSQVAEIWMERGREAGQLDRIEAMIRGMFGASISDVGEIDRQIADLIERRADAMDTAEVQRIRSERTP